MASTPRSAILPIDPEHFSREVLESSRPVVVCFWSSASAPSIDFSPLVSWAAETFQGVVKSVRVDEAAHPELAERYDVHALPTLLAFDGGQRVDRLIGTVVRERLEAFYRAAAERKPRPTVLYFDFSPLVDAERFREQSRAAGYRALALPEGRAAEALDMRLAYDRESAEWGGRVAMLTAEAGQSVPGRVFEVPGADWQAVRQVAGLLGRDVREVKVRVRVEGQVREAVGFATATDHVTQEGPVSERYAFALADAAARAGLSPLYSEDLRARALLLESVQRATGLRPGSE